MCNLDALWMHFGFSQTEEADDLASTFAAERLVLIRYLMSLMAALYAC
jgi:hypothetical protein